ncbi:MAG: Chaperone protein [Firmicutes bacterium]|nr:Chaperone protein [Bacillota bacterium]
MGTKLIKACISDELPKSQLILELVNKANARYDIDFDFLGVLTDFRKVVTAEVSQINRLFPEYTPHDENYHLKHLFAIADLILGPQSYEKMNASELLVLALALYGHDWGMAVSDQEKEIIIDDNCKINNDNFYILPNEHEQFCFYASQNSLSNSGDEKNLDLWRGYVRTTHAFRSAQRIRGYFRKIDSGIGEAVSRVCEGHWLNFEEISDPRSFPTEFSVLREVINLRALTVYVRLVDLFDLAEDRTPYALWKFVAPRNRYSKMEWAKHRCLQPITCPGFLDGRVIRIDGSTDNHEVYAALEDLRGLCEEQFRGCKETLALMRDNRHSLDIDHIEWHITTRGFRPISVKFDFDRYNMIKILTEEIYQSDPYVFLRELLQNSIDAIRMRREILQRNGINSSSIGIIKADVTTQSDATTVITWSDDGVGMDEYTVKNYLAIAGKSYYSSPDFTKEKYKFDPISKFGVGILSCFMVADCIEIETIKEPYTESNDSGLVIKIPSVFGQFRIEAVSRIGRKIGTTITVFMSKHKIQHTNKDITNDFEVTGYLKSIAGFVEFPIVINEKGETTIITHPTATRESLGFFQQNTDSICKSVNQSIDWEEYFLPQDLKNAREELTEITLDITSDLGLNGYEGTFAYLVPKDEQTEIINNVGDRYITKLGQPENLLKSIRLKRNVRQFLSDNEFNEEVGFTKSNKHKKYYRVYRDGILVPQASTPEYFSTEFIDKLPWKLTTNISKVNAPRIDIARSQLLDQRHSWDLKIREAYIQHIGNMWNRRLIEANLPDRLYLIGRILAYHHIASIDLFRIFSIDKLPIPLLNNGQVQLVEFGEIKNKEIRLCSDEFNYDLYELLEKSVEMQKYDGILSRWSGPSCVIQSEHNEGPESILSYIEFINDLIRWFYVHDRLEFCSSPWKNPLLAMRILVPRPEVNGKNEQLKILTKVISEPENMSCEEWRYFQHNVDELSYHIPICTKFGKPYENCFSIAWEFINVNNGTALNYLRAISTITLMKLERKLNFVNYGQILDILQRFPFNSRVFNSKNEHTHIIEVLEELQGVLKSLNILPQMVSIVPTKDEFVPKVEDRVLDAYYKNQEWEYFGTVIE